MEHSIVFTAMYITTSPVCTIHVIDYSSLRRKTHKSSTIALVIVRHKAVIKAETAKTETK